jgi:hypothetical protein
MSDIVERLRRTLSDLPGNDDDLFNEIHAQRDEAADEIERLHAENRQLRKALGKITTLHWFAVPAEIARAALGEGKK